MVQNELPFGPLHNFLFDGSLGDETVDTNSLGLSDSMSTTHSLQIVLGIPVRVEDDDCVSRGQIDSKSAGSCGEKETEVGRTFSIEMVQCLFAKITTHGTVESLEPNTQI